MKRLIEQGKNGAKAVLFLLIVTGFLTSCYTDYGLSSQDHDLVITQYNKKTNFSKYKKYAIIDSVFHITGDTSKPNSEYLSRAYDDFIINTIKNNMNSLGYTEVVNPKDTNDVDIVLYVAALGTKVEQYYYGGWWGGYPCCGWGYYPPYWGYPGYVGTSTYYVGSLFINYVDVANITHPTVDVEWHAILNGLLDNSSHTITQNRLKEKIDQAFDQSPYLSVK
jgi:hypothetical protein